MRCLPRRLRIARGRSVRPALGPPQAQAPEAAEQAQGEQDGRGSAEAARLFLGTQRTIDQALVLPVTMRVEQAAERTAHAGARLPRGRARHACARLPRGGARRACACARPQVGKGLAQGVGRPRVDHRGEFSRPGGDACLQGRPLGRGCAFDRAPFERFQQARRAVPERALPAAGGQRQQIEQAVVGVELGLDQLAVGAMAPRRVDPALRDRQRERVPTALDLGPVGARRTQGRRLVQGLPKSCDGVIELALALLAQRLLGGVALQHRASEAAVGLRQAHRIEDHARRLDGQALRLGQRALLQRVADLDAEEDARGRGQQAAEQGQRPGVAEVEVGTFHGCPHYDRARPAAMAGTRRASRRSSGVDQPLLRA